MFSEHHHDTQLDNIQTHYKSNDRSGYTHSGAFIRTTCADSIGHLLIEGILIALYSMNNYRPKSYFGSYIRS